MSGVLEPNWTIEFIDLLTVLTRLVELETDQAELLERVVAGPMLTRQTLAAEGVRWPQSSADRNPRFAPTSAPDGEQNALDVG